MDAVAIGYIAILIAFAYIVPMLFLVRRQCQAIAEGALAIKQDIIDNAAYHLAEVLASKLNLRRLEAEIEDVYIDYMRQIKGEIQKIKEELEGTAAALDNAVEEVGRARLELKKSIQRLDNETIASDVKNALKDSIESITTLANRLDAAIRQLEEANKTLRGRVEGYYGGILQQIRDVRRYCLETRRAASRCFQLKENGGVSHERGEKA